MFKRNLIIIGIAIFSQTAHSNNLESALKDAGLEKTISTENKEFLSTVNSKSSLLKKEIGDDFGGSWIGYEKSGEPYLAVSTTNPKNLKKSLLSEKRVKFFHTETSYSEIESEFNNLINLVSSNTSYLDDIYGFEINIQEGKIDLRANQEKFDRIASLLNENGLNYEIFNFIHQDAPFQLYGTLHAGSGITFSQNNASATNASFRCTSGFNGTINEYVVAITAGHCARTSVGSFAFFDSGNGSSPVVMGEQIGQTLANEYNNGIDAAIISNDYWRHSFTTTLYKGPYNYAGTVYSPVINAGNLLSGYPLCTQGRTTGWRCGTFKGAGVQGINQILFRHSTAYICGAPGDSGGPVVSNTGNPMALYIGAEGNFPTGNCGPSFGGGQRNTSLIQPLNPILEKYPSLKIRSM